MSLAYTITILGRENIWSVETDTIDTRRANVFKRFDELKKKLEGDGVTSQIRLSVWYNGEIVPARTQTVYLNEPDEDEDEDEEEEYDEEDYEDDE